MIKETIQLSEPTEAINSRILKVSEDLLVGFHQRPFDEIKPTLVDETPADRIDGRVA